MYCQLFFNLLFFIIIQPSKSRIHNVCSKKDRLPLLVTYVHKSGRINEHKIKLRVINGEWSKLFVLGAVGKIVNVTSVCRKRNFPHEVSESILITVANRDNQNVIHCTVHVLLINKYCMRVGISARLLLCTCTCTYFSINFCIMIKKKFLHFF